MNFYLLREKSGTNVLFKNTGEDKNRRECDKCGGVQSIIKNPLKVQLRDDKTSDFYQMMGNNIIGSGIQDTLIRHNFKGFKLSPIEIKNEERLLDKELFNLARIEATGKGGFLQDHLGNKIPHCETCGTFLNILRISEGLSVDEKEWDGSDIFYFNNWYGNLIITEDVYKVLNESNTQNVRFINLREFSNDYRRSLK
ncbi:hypothetical protein PVA17_24125 [Lysinibacillus sp. CNPSo 3705]|uniref:hypothetical protein n=1 Tax=Lysinibacillus sp. CNPSo 3705 TaxID=3028148 RepID=UPI0023641C28|nr:hypothetical protein [Lysinibacillus sp. CNPSo 3705]MDD1505809.1 hypothetical protein [Lysinibacillus sp. CNPSo 3705]